MPVFHNRSITRRRPSTWQMIKISQRRSAEKTYAEYRRSREEMRELLTAKANVDRVLKMEVEQDVEKEKDHDQR